MDPEQFIVQVCERQTTLDLLLQLLGPLPVLLNCVTQLMEIELNEKGLVLLTSRHDGYDSTARPHLSTYWC